MSTFFNDPEDAAAVEADCWRLLERAVTDPNSDWRLPVLATVTDGVCRQRIVVLRSVQAESRTILAHTDVRSSKVRALHDNPRSSWLFYDANRNVQMQLVGTTQIHTDNEVANELWHSQPASSLRGYLAPKAPGTPCTAADINLPEAVRDRLPDAAELAKARTNFAVISCQAMSIEWLMLRRIGNLRLRIKYDTHDCPSHEWLAP